MSGQSTNSKNEQNVPQVSAAFEDLASGEGTVNYNTKNEFGSSSLIKHGSAEALEDDLDNL